MTVVKPFIINSTAHLMVPEKATVSCEVQNPRCVSRQIDECGLVETTVCAFIKIQSEVKESIVIPFVASCPVGLCSRVVTENEDHNSDLIDESDETM